MTGGKIYHNHTLDNAYALIGFSWSGDTSCFVGFNEYEGPLFESKTIMPKLPDYISKQMQINSTKIAGSTNISDNIPPYIVIAIWKRIT